MTIYNQKVNYRIIEVNENENAMVVRYWTDLISEKSLASHFDNDGNIILTEGGYPTRCRTDVNINFNFNVEPSEEDIIRKIHEVAPLQFLIISDEKTSGNMSFQLSNVKNLLGKAGSFNKTLEVRNDNLLPPSVAAAENIFHEIRREYPNNEIVIEISPAISLTSNTKDILRISAEGNLYKINDHLL